MAIMPSYGGECACGGTIWHGYRSSKRQMDPDFVGVRDIPYTECNKCGKSWKYKPLSDEVFVAIKESLEKRKKILALSNKDWNGLWAN